MYFTNLFCNNEISAEFICDLSDELFFEQWNTNEEQKIVNGESVVKVALRKNTFGSEFKLDDYHILLFFLDSTDVSTLRFCSEFDFRWSDDFNEDKIEKLLRQNGSVLLLSYIRQLVASLSLQAGVGPINIPFLDFSQD